MKFSLVSCSMKRFLQVPGTNFSVCVVLNPTEEFTEFVTPPHYTKRAFFHRTDLTTDPPPRCNSFRRAVFKGMTGHYVVQKYIKWAWAHLTKVLTVQFTKLSTEPFPALPGTIPVERKKWEDRLFLLEAGNPAAWWIVLQVLVVFPPKPRINSPPDLFKTVCDNCQALVSQHGRL